MWRNSTSLTYVHFVRDYFACRCTDRRLSLEAPAFPICLSFYLSLFLKCSHRDSEELFHFCLLENRLIFGIFLKTKFDHIETRHSGGWEWKFRNFSSSVISFQKSRIIFPWGSDIFFFLPFTRGCCLSPRRFFQTFFALVNSHGIFRFGGNRWISGVSNADLVAISPIKLVIFPRKYLIRVKMIKAIGITIEERWHIVASTWPRWSEN